MVEKGEMNKQIKDKKKTKKKTTSVLFIKI